MSIRAFTEEDIVDRNISSDQDIADYVPNLMIFENGMSGMNSPSMRGIHAAPHTFSTTTGLYVDRVPPLSGAGFAADGLSLTAGFGYSDVEIDDFRDARADYDGNQNPFAPEYTVNLGAQYRHLSGFHARADLVGYGRMYYDKANDYSKEAYQIVNAKVGYEMEQLDVYFYAANRLARHTTTMDTPTAFIRFTAIRGKSGCNSFTGFRFRLPRSFISDKK